MTRSVRIAKSACMADFEVTGSVNYLFLCRLENAILIYFCLAIARQGAGHNRLGRDEDGRKDDLANQCLKFQVR